MMKDFKVGDEVYFYYFLDGKAGIASGVIIGMIEDEEMDGGAFVVVEDKERSSEKRYTMMQRCFGTEEECRAAVEKMDCCK